MHIHSKWIAGLPAVTPPDGEDTRRAQLVCRTPQRTNVHIISWIIDADFKVAHPLIIHAIYIKIFCRVYFALRAKYTRQNIFI